MTPLKFESEFADLIEAHETQRLQISGRVYTRATALLRSFAGAFLVLLGVLTVWWGYTGTLSEQGFGTAFLFGTFLFVAGWCVPKSNSQYLDLGNRQIVKMSWYGILPPSRTLIPLSDFSEIVVRHVCHPGGEAEDTYTGAVGLKAKLGGPILWVKEFPATKDEMPTEPNLYARDLSELIGLLHRGDINPPANAEEKV